MRVQDAAVEIFICLEQTPLLRLEVTGVVQHLSDHSLLIVDQLQVGQDALSRTPRWAAALILCSNPVRAQTTRARSRQDLLDVAGSRRAP